MRFQNYVIKSIGTTTIKTSCKDAKLIRLALQEELQAINDYTMRAKMAENEATKKLFLDIATEEKIHFEEFEELLEAIDEEYETTEEDADNELEDMFGEESEKQEEY